jgi:hypothetical protein
MRATCLRTHHHPVNEKSFKISLNLQKNVKIRPLSWEKTPFLRPIALFLSSRRLEACGLLLLFLSGQSWPQTTVKGAFCMDAFHLE